MTYQRLYESVHTGKAKEAADDLRWLNGFETEVQPEDQDYVEEIENRETGGC